MNDINGLRKEILKVLNEGPNLPDKVDTQIYRFIGALSTTFQVLAPDSKPSNIIQFIAMALNAFLNVNKEAEYPIELKDRLPYEAIVICVRACYEIREKKEHPIFKEEEETDFEALLKVVEQGGFEI